ncbi:OB-fold-containig protein [Microvirga zambiensis]|uniref:OB-fold-containig protein n=1 Tax=Microvirga zambiensis TaxID=1402137 RepID=UPI00191FC76F|nr:OB-fold-containig protein [Microvirga zambiensis]
MDVLLSGSYQPFIVAGLVMTCLVAIETISLVAGFSLSHFIDQSFESETFGGYHADTGETGFIGGLMGWINAGRVPLLIVIITWLAAFAAAGFMLQTLAASLLAPLPVAVAGFIAFGLAAPATRFTTRLVSRIVPRDETYVVSDADLIGRVAEVTLGPLDRGPAGRVKVRDTHGNWHFPMAKLADGHDPIPVGAQALLVERNGTTFLVIPAPDDLKTIT